MGLSSLPRWAPVAAVVVNGVDVTANFLPRLVAITLTDTAGVQADTAEIILADHVTQQPIAIPATGAEVEISLGYAMQAKTVGLYVVEEVEVSGPPGQIRITAFASAFGASDQGKSAVNEQKTRSWPEGTKVSALVGKIASETGFKAAVSTEAGKIELPHLDQMNESDMNLIARVCRDNGLIFKPGGGSLVVVKTGESTSAGGEPLPTVPILLDEVTRWRFSVSRPGAVKKVVATHRNRGSAQTVEVVADNGGAYTEDEILNGVRETVRLKRTYTTAPAAKAAAKAEADNAFSSSRKFTCDLPGNPALMAEGKLQLIGWRPGVPTEWLVKQVQHQVDSGGWKTIVNAELPPPKS